MHRLKKPTELGILGSQQRIISKFIWHPHYYMDKEYHNDFVLLKVDSPFNFNEVVHNVCLPDNNYTPDPLTPLCTVTGSNRY